MIGITPTDIFPLNYPCSDPSIPSKGAKAVPVVLDWSKDNSYEVNLLQVRDQKNFGSLRCLWIDARQCIQNFTVAVNGTEQIFLVLAGTANYYPVINLNVPNITFSMSSVESSLARIICINFVPALNAPNQSVVVSNFPILATQISSDYVHRTGFNHFFGPGITLLKSIYIVSNSPMLAGFTEVDFYIADNNNHVLCDFLLPISASTTPLATLVDMQNLNIAVAASPLLLYLSNALDSGSYFIALSAN